MPQANLNKSALVSKRMLPPVRGGMGAGEPVIIENVARDGICFSFAQKGGIR